MSEKRQFFGTDGVRAVANRHPMTPEFVMRLAQAAAVVLGGKLEGGERPRCRLGRDTRASGEMLEAALAAGLNSAGVDVILAGQLPTPAVAMLSALARRRFRRHRFRLAQSVQGQRHQIRPWRRPQAQRQDRDRHREACARHARTRRVPKVAASAASPSWRTVWSAT
jgi:hypothetical protein